MILLLFIKDGLSAQFGSGIPLSEKRALAVSVGRRRGGAERDTERRCSRKKKVRGHPSDGGGGGDALGRGGEVSEKRSGRGRAGFRSIRRRERGRNREWADSFSGGCGGVRNAGVVCAAEGRRSAGRGERTGCCRLSFFGGGRIIKRKNYY